MSGWIKLDKELPESIRFGRVVRSVRERNALPGVTDRDVTFVKTLCVGALVRLWIYADSHIGESNQISATFDEIDELVGVPGFAASLPSDWLVKIDEETVELPDFLEHNGSSAKQRRDNAARQAKWRENHKPKSVTRGVTRRNASNVARPDQTRPEQKTDGAEAPPLEKPSDPKKRPSRRCPSDFEVSDDLKLWASTECPGVDIATQTKAFRDYEFRNSHTDWPATWRTWMRKAAEKTTPAKPARNPYAGAQ